MIDTDTSLGGVRGRLLGDFPMLEEIRKRRPLYIEKLARTVRDCAEYNQRYVMPVALELDRRMEKDHTYEAWDLVKAGMQYRFLSLIIPSLVGGTGGLAVLFSLAMEEMCSACPGVANIFGAHALGVTPLLVGGSMSHWETILREIAESEKKGVPVIMALAITEPSAGTDAEEPHYLSGARLSMQAKKVPGGYVLNGRKCFISNGSIAKYIWVTSATDREHPAESWTGFIVDREMEGFSVARVEEKMGQRVCPAAELAFEDCFVPDDYVVSFEGDGMQPGTLLTMAASRSPVGAIATGIARGAYEWFLHWAQRNQNGRRPISEQRVQMALADMRTHIQLARWAYMNGALAFDNSVGSVMNGLVLNSMNLLPRSVRTSRPFYRFFLSKPGKHVSNTLISLYTSNDDVTRALAYASLAKAVGGDTAMYVSSLALEHMGSKPCEEKLWVEKAFRDAKLTQIYEGTNQLNRLTLFMSNIEKSLTLELHKPLKGSYSASGGVA
jgi:butyryl-CoA dehydrogenase